MDCNADVAKDESHDELINLDWVSKGSGILVAAGDFNTPFEKMSASEAFLDDRYALPAQQKDNRERLLQVCADNKLCEFPTRFPSHSDITL